MPDPTYANPGSALHASLPEAAAADDDSEGSDEGEDQCVDAGEEAEEDEEEDEEEEEGEEEEETDDDVEEQIGKDLCDGTGEHAWPTGLAMAEAMKLPKVASIVSGKSVLELGSGGSGVVGLAALDAGAAEVVLTDRASVLPRLEQTVRRRGAGAGARVEELNWGDVLANHGQTREFDVILASDVLYNTRAGYSKLVKTLTNSCKPGSSFLLGCRWRKPGLERRFFRSIEFEFDIGLFDLRESVIASSFCAANLGWKEFGNPRCEASNEFLMQDIAVGGVPVPVAEIDDEHMLRLSDSEHRVFESIFTQLYLLTRKSSAGEAMPAAVENIGSSRKRKATYEL